ncbi:putative ribonuclease H-like domain-containing protein [Tanacetum coccineum]
MLQMHKKRSILSESARTKEDNRRRGMDGILEIKMESRNWKKEELKALLWISLTGTSAVMVLSRLVNGNTRRQLNILSKYNGGSSRRNYSNFKDPQGDRLRAQTGLGPLEKGYKALTLLTSKTLMVPVALEKRISVQDCFELANMAFLIHSTNFIASKSVNKERGPREKNMSFLDESCKTSHRQEREANEESCLKPIRIFLAFARIWAYEFYQYDVKSAISLWQIDEEVCACSRFQVTPKTSHLSAVKRIFRYLKGKPKLGLWYPRVSSFDLESYSDSDYAGANLDRKSTTGGVVRPSQETGSMSCSDNKGDELPLVRSVSSIPDTYIVHSLFGQVLVSDHAKWYRWAKFVTLNVSLEKITPKYCPKHKCSAYLKRLRNGLGSYSEVIDFIGEVICICAHCFLIQAKQRFPRKSFSKKHRVHKEYVSKQGRKKAKGESSVQRNPLGTKEMVDEVKEFDEDRLSTEDWSLVLTRRSSPNLKVKLTDQKLVLTDPKLVLMNKFKVLKSKEKARIKADKNLAEKLQEQDKRQFTIEKSMFLHDTIAYSESSVSTATMPYVSAASTSTCANAGESSFVYLGGKIPIDASSLPNADLPIDPNMPDLEDDSDAFSRDPKSAIQTRGKIQKASSAQQALEEGIDYDEVFAHVARIEAIRLFLAFASYMGFTVYQMDVKSAFLYGTIEEEVYVHQPPGFVDPAHPNKVYKVIKALYGLHQAPRAWYETLSSFLLENGFRRGIIDKTLFIMKKKSDIMLVQVYVDDIIFGSTKKSMCTEFEDCMHKRFQMSSMGELTFFLGLQVKQQPDGIFISQDKYVADILKKFDFWSIRTATTPIESNKPLVKDEDGEDVDVHVYRSMIGSLMYLTASRPDIMFAVCACARFQVTPKASHLNAVKRIFRYLKHQPKLGLWYPRDSPFELEAFSDSDYGGASLDRKSTTSGCQFLGRRLISWQCKKQTIVANSTTEAEYVAAANCCGQVLWIQNQMMDYGFNFMNTKIHIDNESTISVIKNPVAHSRTKHIEIRFHFIRDCYEKRLIEVIKIHTDHNVTDLLTKGFDVTRFNFLVVSIGLLNL